MTDSIRAIHGDSRGVLKTLAGGSVDSCVCDPPYSLVSIVKRFGANGSAPAKGNAAYMRASAGFMGQKWDTGETAHDPEFWREVYRVLKPGAHVVAFAGTRTYHRLACAIEDAGFEIRDQIAWLFGSGFPKSHDVSKAIDRAAGAEREVVGQQTKARSTTGASALPTVGGDTIYKTWDVTAPAIDSARQWQGWGTALKPALEPIVLARKPLIGTVADNVLTHGVGAINVDGCRVACDDKTPFPVGANSADGSIKTGLHSKPRGDDTNRNGRWPANVLHDGSEEVVGAFPDSIARPVSPENIGKSGSGEKRGMFGNGSIVQSGYYDTEVSAARFFYTAKADSDDRIGSKHPTVKPVDLMQYLVRLVTPKGGLVLDCFAGTGVTGEAAHREGMRCILIEREAQYFQDIQRRIRLLNAGPDERARESLKAAGKVLTDPGPLFGGVA